MTFFSFLILFVGIFIHSVNCSFAFKGETYDQTKFYPNHPTSSGLLEYSYVLETFLLQGFFFLQIVGIFLHMETIHLQEMKGMIKFNSIQIQLTFFRSYEHYYKFVLGYIKFCFQISG